MTNQAFSGEHEPRAGGNRQRLVDAGHAVLSGQGLAATTVKEIARAAGVSPGLFHYYFASKDELLLAVLADAGDRFQARLVRQAGPGRTPQDRIGSAVEFIARTAEAEPALFRLRYEFYALGLRNPAFRSAVGSQLAYAKDNIVRILGQWFPEVDQARRSALAALILACFDGLALQRLSEPDAELTPAYALLREVMEAHLAPRLRST